MTPRTSTIISLLLIMLANFSAYAETPTGLSIMQAADSRYDGDDVIQSIHQQLIDRNGNTREREMISFRKDFGKDKKMITFFRKPANIIDTALLTFDYDDPNSDDDQWLYLPALKKVRRISSSDRGDYFMGTDFTFEDMKQSPELSDYQWKLLGSEVVHDHDCWKVEGIPSSKEIGQELGYSRLVQYVTKNTSIAIRVDYWDLADRELKHLRVNKMEEIQHIWSAVSVEMHNVQSNHTTVISFTEQRYNSGLKDRLFTQRALKRGYRKQ